jgi:hypothetical protein
MTAITTMALPREEPQDRHDYRFIANGALKSSITLTATKMLGALWLNMQQGGTVSVARWHGIVPYIVFHLDPLHFTEVTTYSTIGAALVGTFVLIRKSLGASKNIRRASGALPIVIGTVWLVAVDLTLHFLRHGYIQPRPMLGAVALLLIQLAVAFVFITRHGDAIRAEALIQPETERAEEPIESPATSPIAHLAPISPVSSFLPNTTPTTTNPTTGAFP